MPYHTHVAANHAVLMATAWLILFGAALMPALIVLARLTVRSAVRATVAMLVGELLKWAAITLAAAALAVASMTSVPAAAAETCPPDVASSVAPESTTLDMSITAAFLSVTGKSKRPMPIWLLESAARIYTAYKAYKNGQKVEEAFRIAQAALAEISNVRTEIEAGRVFSKQEQRLTRTRLRAQEALIEGLDRRVSSLEGRTERLEQKTNQVAGVVGRRGCPALHAWDRNFRRCTNRR
jgi:hypothetical protein